MGELIRFPVERRSQQRPCISLLRSAKVIELRPKPRLVHARPTPFGGLPVDWSDDRQVATAMAFNAFSYGTGFFSINGSEPTTGGNPSTG